MKLVHGIVISETGETKNVTLSNLKDYQDAVGGLIELIQFEGGSMYVNEEGLLMGMDANRRASCIVGFVVVGPALVVGPDDGEGNDTSILPEWREALR